MDNRIRTLVLIIPLILLFSACSPGQLLGPAPTSTPIPCIDQAADFLAQAPGIIQEWTDADKIAGSTARIQLPAQIASLQAIKRKADALAIPDCAADLKNFLVRGFDSSINGYIAFMGKQPDSIVREYFDTSAYNLSSYADALSALHQGLAFIAPTRSLPTIPATAAPSCSQLAPDFAKLLNDNPLYKFLPGYSVELSNFEYKVEKFKVPDCALPYQAALVKYLKLKLENSDYYMGEASKDLDYQKTLFEAGR